MLHGENSSSPVVQSLVLLIAGVWNPLSILPHESPLVPSHSIYPSLFFAGG
jgi:hypothetical protein